MKYYFGTYIFGFSLILNLIKAENCDEVGHLIYEDLRCKPVLQEGHACPVKYDCNLEVKNDTCTFRGRTIPVYQELTEKDTYGACLIGCNCEETNKFQCAELDCPEWLGDYPVKFGCYRKYAIGECCSVGQNCPPAKTTPFQCLINGAISIEGERYFPENTCLECVCNRGYKGKDEAPFCQRRNCAAQVENSDKIHKYCAPVYGAHDRVLCCPNEWVCPSKNDKPLPHYPRADSLSEMTCKFGDKTLKMGERIKGEYVLYNQPKQAQCECVVPPLLTCRDIPTTRSTPATLGFKIVPITMPSSETSTA